MFSVHSEQLVYELLHGKANCRSSAETVASELGDLE